MKDYIEETKNFRLELLGVLSNLEASERESKARDIAICRLRESIMWLGLDLDALGVPNPYKEIEADFDLCQ